MRILLHPGAASILILLTAIGCAPPPPALKPLPGVRAVAFPSLPVDLSRVAGPRELRLPAEAVKLLEKNGFVVAGPAGGSMPDCYRSVHCSDC